jgi:hypothetical protein
MEDMHEALLHRATKAAILDYAGMSQTGEAPPETFIRDICAIKIHQEKSWCVRIELPARDCTQWTIDRSKLIHLSKDFRIDLVCFRERGGKASDLEMLVEFKLWTDYDDVLKDVRRLQEMIELLSKADKQLAERVKGYVVCVPHYESFQRVNGAVFEFSKRFELVQKNNDENIPFLTNARSSESAAAIIILDVKKVRALD